jgi:hypothetical protein
MALWPTAQTSPDPAGNPQKQLVCFLLVLRDAQAADRAALVRDLVAAGFEVRPILIGNFAKN